MAHLKKASSGHLLKTSSGHLSKDCGDTSDPCLCPTDILQWPGSDCSNWPYNGWTCKYDISGTLDFYNDDSCGTKQASCSFAKRVQADDDPGRCAEWRATFDEVLCNLCSGVDAKLKIVDLVLGDFNSDGSNTYRAGATVTLDEGSGTSTRSTGDRDCANGITGQYPDGACSSTVSYPDCGGGTTPWSIQLRDVTVSEV